MSTATPFWLSEGDPVAAAAVLAPDRQVVPRVDDEAAFDLGARRLVWPVTVTRLQDCAGVLEALVRGVAVVVRIGDDVDQATRSRFVDELQRASGCAAGLGVTTELGCERTSLLSDDQRELLRELGRGATMATAAASVGLGERTAARRLLEARRLLGVETTAQAVLQVNRQAG